MNEARPLTAADAIHSGGADMGAARRAFGPPPAIGALKKFFSASYRL